MTIARWRCVALKAPGAVGALIALSFVALQVVACAPKASVPVTSPPVYELPAPDAREPMKPDAIRRRLERIAALSCEQHIRCRSYLCAPVGAMAEVCHPGLVGHRIDGLMKRIESGRARFEPAYADIVERELEAMTPCRTQRTEPGCAAGINRIAEVLGGAPRERDDLPLSDGANCASTLDCQAGRICSVEDGCGAPLPEGAACGSSLGPSQLSRCADGLVCTQGGCGVGIAWGHACRTDSSGDPCMHGTVCRKVDGPSDYACVRIAQPGGPCGDNTICPESFHCNDKGVCEALPWSDDVCQPAVGCALGAGTCIDGHCRPAPVGGVCETHDLGLDVCEAGAGCDPESNTCVRLATVGQPCKYDHLCATDRCQDRQCAPEER